MDVELIIAIILVIIAILTFIYSFFISPRRVKIQIGEIGPTEPDLKISCYNIGKYKVDLDKMYVWVSPEIILNIDELKSKKFPDSILPGKRWDVEINKLSLAEVLAEKKVEKEVKIKFVVRNELEKIYKSKKVAFNPQRLLEEEKQRLQEEKRIAEEKRKEERERKEEERKREIKREERERKEREKGIATLEPSFTYLIEEKIAVKVYKLFESKVKEGLNGFCIARTFPDKIRERYNFSEEIPILWLSNVRKEGTVRPKDLETLSLSIEQFISGNPRGIIVIVGLEYLITNNNFITIHRLIQSLRDIVAINRYILLLGLNPESLDSSQLNLLRREVDRCESVITS